ncbi:NAD-dependent malic enzyme [Frankia sp. CNm7]|uniref:Putative malate oxidoreductase [NAD] n=1 Tax=Frankia nepalensis TaxID=1836974 RepID=A0A937UNC6_9ACTN|nr:NAD-dependent malic enzyme [Frankia nepalensis]MBL7498000.1 NAD-dependent malic enzyme [Frankia nepalensis]MBL7509082.1 NAD-dependent malic enzyme [Frankia nepalensis]MBL7516815.1 NAD-dependent malic enzyme [Frankia nepalensis]MBL7627812.1 NAD-dependent malic enzyme [Frankia nepalensis]
MVVAGARRGFWSGDGGLVTTARGAEVLDTPLLNKGMAFSPGERRALGLEGLLPSAVLSLDEQLARAYEQYHEQPTDLLKNVFLAMLQDNDEVLFYRLLGEHLREMLPVVYDPTVGEAIRRYSHEYRRPRGVYLSIDRPDRVAASLADLGLGAADVDLIVASDAEEILGIGDWGVGGIDIAVGKLAVYTAAAGIDPGRAIPVGLDVGTDNEDLLSDPAYVGNRHRRVRGPRYDEFIEAYVNAASTLFPNAMLHWEDFGPSNGRRILEKYRNRVCTFNDDMQGTGAITLGAVLGGLRVAGTRPRDQRIVVFGAGTAGVGIADQLRDAIVRDGAERDAATRQVWCIDQQGLLTDDMTDLRDFQVPYARPAREVTGWRREGRIGLAEVVAQVHPTILIGTSTVHGAFTEEIVREMARHVDRPIILPLSNPTERIEAMPSQLIPWTAGRGLICTGIPVPAVTYDGVTYSIGQANNALLYPGLGLGATVARAKTISDGMLAAAADAVASLADVRAPGASLLPEVDTLRSVSATVAVAVADRAAAEGLARATLTDTARQVQDAMWQPEYRPISAA